MPGFIAHFGFGLITSLPFVILDKKGRYRTLIVGSFAATIADIDAPGVFFDIIEHRGFIHSLELWAIVSVIAFIVFMLLAGIDILRGSLSSNEAIFDKLFYVGAFSIGWLTHWIADFGFTDYENQKGLIVSLTNLQLEILNNAMAVFVAIFLGAIIWLEIRDKPERDIPVGKFFKKTY
ncbi:MAG: metal-dependent hydrolase [Candidatus Hodarchaeales archaeon]|jgi:hypothetical protein